MFKKYILPIAIVALLTFTVLIIQPFAAPAGEPYQAQPFKQFSAGGDDSEMTSLTLSAAAIGACRLTVSNELFPLRSRRQCRKLLSLNRLRTMQIRIHAYEK